MDKVAGVVICETNTLYNLKVSLQSHQISLFHKDFKQNLKISLYSHKFSL